MIFKFTLTQLYLFCGYLSSGLTPVPHRLSQMENILNTDVTLKLQSLERFRKGILNQQFTI